MNLKSMYPEEEIFFRSRPKRSKSTHHHRNGPRLRLHSLTLSLTLRLLFTSIRLLWLEKEGREPSKQKPRNHTLVDHVRYQPASQPASCYFWEAASEKFVNVLFLLIIAMMTTTGNFNSLPLAEKVYSNPSQYSCTAARVAYSRAAGGECMRVCEWEVITGPKLTLTISISSWVCFDLQFFLWPQ